MFQGLRNISIDDVLVTEETFYLLKNNKINILPENLCVIKIGKTSQLLTKRLKQYTFDHNQPNEKLHKICKEHGIETRDDYQDSWDIKGQWVIPRNISSKKIEDKIKTTMTASELNRFGNSEYFSINDSLTNNLISEIDSLFKRLNQSNM
ncbi:MAG: hypothetical protein ACJAS1_006051 [Oleiphilaceae bacterium]|jgi:hypothetical protein